MHESFAQAAERRAAEVCGVFPGSEAPRSAFTLGYIAWRLGVKRDDVPACLKRFSLMWKRGWDCAGSDAALAVLRAEEA
jgi:hypothetical protein